MRYMNLRFTYLLVCYNQTFVLCTILKKT